GRHRLNPGENLLGHPTATPHRPLASRPVPPGSSPSTNAPMGRRGTGSSRFSQLRRVRVSGAENFALHWKKQRMQLIHLVRKLRADPTRACGVRFTGLNPTGEHFELLSDTSIRFSGVATPRTSARLAVSELTFDRHKESPPHPLRQCCPRCSFSGPSFS